MMGNRVVSAQRGLRSGVRACALLLALMLCAMGCASAPVPAPPTPPASTAPLPEITFAPLPALALPELPAPAATAFADMEYARPDVERFTQWMERVTQRIPATTDFRTLQEWAQTARRLDHHMDTMHALAMLHSSMDKSDAYWLAEYDWTSQQRVTIYHAYRELRLALLHSESGEALRAVLPPDFFFGFSNESGAYPDSLVPLYAREQSLITEYEEKIATLAIEYNGESMTLTDISAMNSYTPYIEAYAIWCDTYQAQFAQLYIELVRLRNEIAALRGYESYAHLIIANEQRDYTPEMMQQYIDDIVEYLVPLYPEMEQKKDAMDYLHVDVALDDFYDFLADTMERFEPGLLEPLLAMHTYGLSDLDARPFKDSGAFTVYLPEYQLPYLFLTYAGDYSSMTTLAHEYGHFLDRYLMPELGATETLDMAELFSQGMELLISNHYDELVSPDVAKQMRYNCVSDTVSMIVTLPHLTAFELAVYALPDNELTVERVNRIAQEQAERFHLTSEYYPLHYEQGWVSVLHLFSLPYYTFTYATSSSIALQIWELSLTDEQAAVDTYLAMLKREQSEQFLENVKTAGLKSPFAPGRAKEQALFCKRYLIDEDWAPQERAA